VYLANRALIDRMASMICRRNRTTAADADDFRSAVHLHFVQHDYAVLRAYSGRGDLGGFLLAVIRRLFQDWRNANWGRFSHKSTTILDGRPVHIYQVKPRAKRLGLFKGRIYLDARSGTLVRAEGRMVKSPSLFIKSIHFEQNYVDIAGFTFPSRIHSEARTRIVGNVVVDIYDQDYQPGSFARPGG